MSVGPSAGVAGSAAGAPFAQTKGSEAERASQDSSQQQRQIAGERSAADAAGIGQTEEDQGASERDADGRRIWEKGQDKDKEGEGTGEGQPEPKRQSKDPQGESGSKLDLSG